MISRTGVRWDVDSLRRWRHDARLPFRARCVPDGLVRCRGSALATLPLASAMSLSRSEVECW
jgi:hypothetical protein